jgi:hypothetical protein
MAKGDNNAAARAWLHGVADQAEARGLTLKRELCAVVLVEKVTPSESDGLWWRSVAADAVAQGCVVTFDHHGVMCLVLAPYVPKKRDIPMELRL